MFPIHLKIMITITTQWQHLEFDDGDDDDSFYDDDDDDGGDDNNDQHLELEG